MPPNRPGLMKYVTATKAVAHGAPCIESESCGIAVKQKTPDSSMGAGVLRARVEIGEPFAIISKGIVEVPTVAGAGLGSVVWIHIGTNALTAADPGATNGRRFGQVVELAGVRGGRTTHIRVDLDRKGPFT